MTTVMIGIDPHKATHTAVAVDRSERALDRLVVPAGQDQTTRLCGWADRFEQRTWAVEAADGLGCLVAQQLVAAGETVLDVPPVLAARVRTLDSTSSDKTDLNDARSVAVCAWRTPSLNRVARTDHTRVLALVAKRHRDLGRHKTKQASRLHALLLELVPGGLAGRLTVTRANAVLDDLDTVDPIDAARLEVARELLDDIARLDRQLTASHRRVSAAVDASGTSLTDIRGVGAIGAATILGEVGDIARFENRHRFAAYNGTAPVAASSGPHTRHRLNTRGNRRLNHVLHIAAVNQLRHPGPGRDYYDRKRAEGKTSKEAIRSLKRRISDAVWRQLRADQQR